MKSLPLIFLGIFFTLAFSWTGLVLTSDIQMRHFEPVSSTLVNQESEEIAGIRYVGPDGEVRLGQTNPELTQFPRLTPGEALRGKEVYANLGCVYCHSQQVRRKGFGSDWERGWGDRQSVARDYIRQKRVLLGTSRTGPDLMTVGQRIPTEDWHHLHLFNPRITSEASIMPSFAFLYDVQPIGPNGPSPKALKLRDASGQPIIMADGGRLPEKYLPPEGYEVVPSRRAEELVAYLLSLRLDYELPEAKFVTE